MPGIVLLDGLPILGNDDLINRFVPIIARPAGALPDTVGAIGQVLRSAFSIFSDGDNILFRFFGLVVAASRFQINGECCPFLRLLVPGYGVHGVLHELNLALNHRITDRHRKAVLRLIVMVIAGFQRIHCLVQLVPGGRFGFLEGVHAIILGARKQICGEAAVGNGIGGNRLAGFVQGVLGTVQRCVTLRRGLAGVCVHLCNGCPPVLPDVLHGGVGYVVPGDGNGLRLWEDVCIARRDFLQSIRPNFDVLEVCLAIGTGGGGNVHGIPLVTGAMQPEGEA